MSANQGMDNWVVVQSSERRQHQYPIINPIQRKKCCSAHWIEVFFNVEMTEKLCLQWNEFHDNIKNVFGILREGYDFADITLACEDGQQVEAHKVILASSSPFFKKLLGRNKQPHPIIFMRGVKYDNLVALVEFLYTMCIL